MTNYNRNNSSQLLVFISDNTGVASETLGLTLMTQFGDYSQAQQETLPFIRSEEAALMHSKQINEWKNEFTEVIVFSTIVSERIRNVFKENLTVSMFDLFENMLPKISFTLNKNIQPTIGNRHQDKKDLRASAIDYALSFDDGQQLDFDDSDIILLGLSRSGKTPTAMWLALHYGLNAANYPITEDDFVKNKIPDNIIKNLHKCVILIQTPERLSQIRQERYKNSKYASIENCRKELDNLSKLSEIKNLPKVDVSNKSVEEIAANALMLTNIHPKGRF